MDLTPAEARDLLGAYVLDALDEDEWAAVEQHLALDPDLARAAAELRAVGALLGAADATAPAVGLRQRTLAAAGSARAPGRSLVEPAHPRAAFAAQAADLAAVLDEVDGNSWGQPTLAGFTVHELVAHLVAVEGYLGRVLGVGSFSIPEGTEADHRAMTLPTIEGYRHRPPEAALVDRRDGVATVQRRLEELGDDAMRDRVQFHGLDVSLRSVLVMRIFELWTHTDDIRRALHRPLATPPPDRLILMADTAVRALPLGVTMTHGPVPGRTAKLVLTGLGGGTWTTNLALGEAPAAAADVMVVADVVEFCRLAAQRLAPEDLDAYIEGNAELAGALLAGAQVFAA